MKILGMEFDFESDTSLHKRHMRALLDATEASKLAFIKEAVASGIHSPTSQVNGKVHVVRGSSTCDSRQFQLDVHETPGGLRMRLKPLPKVILFALAMYATIGTYRYCIETNKIPTPPPIRHVVSEEAANAWAQSMMRDGDTNIALKTLTSPGYSTGWDALITPRPVQKQFPFSVAVAWMLLLFVTLGLYLFKPSEPDEDEYAEYGPKVTII
jgi:hypothetical protein